MSMNFRSCKTGKCLLFRQEMRCKDAGAELIIELEGVGCQGFSNPNTAKEIQCTNNDEWTIAYGEEQEQKKIVGIFCKVTSNLCITQCSTPVSYTPKEEVIFKIREYL